MSRIALAKPGLRVKPAWVLALAAAVGVAAFTGGAVYLARRPGGWGGSVDAWTTVTATVRDFDVRVETSGEIQAVDNLEITCDVEGMNTLTRLIPEGSEVKEGDVLALIDSSKIYIELEEGVIKFEQAKSDVTSAIELAEIQKSKNAADLEAAQVALQLAQQDLKKYTEGLYPQLEADAQTALKMAEITLRNKQEDLAQTRSLFQKGFVTATEIKEKELEVTTAQNELEKARRDLNVLVEYSNVMDLTSKKNALAQAEQKVQRQTRENAANLNKVTADVRAKTQALDVIKRRNDRYTKQLESCTIKAPADGLVVYNENRYGEGPLSEGSEVRERQVLLRLPDTRSMKVVTRVNESIVGRLKPGQQARVKITNVPDAIPATLEKISVMADGGRRWMNPDVKEFPVDLKLKWTPGGLKPGMRSEASILIDSVRRALTVPLAAIYTSGATRYVFLPEGEVARPVEIRVGRMNDREIEVTSGLVEGQPVVLLAAGQGRELLEKAGIKPAEPATRPAEEQKKTVPSGTPKPAQSGAKGRPAVGKTDTDTTSIARKNGTNGDKAKSDGRAGAADTSGVSADKSIDASTETTTDTTDTTDTESKTDTAE